MSSQPYNIVFQALDYVSPITDQIVDCLQNIEYETLDIGFVSEELATFSANDFRNVIYSAQMALFYTSMLASGFLKSESSTIAVDMAQDRYNEIVAKYGANSSQAERALESLNRALLLLQRNMMVTNIMMVSVGLQFASMALLSQGTLVGLGTITAALRATATTVREFWASLGPFGWPILAGTLVAGGIATAYAAGAFNKAEIPKTITVDKNTNANQAVDQYARKLKRAFNASELP